MENHYSKAQLEDKALKSASMYFGQELLPYFKINKRIVRMLPTEQIRLEAIRQTEDILFEMDDGTLAHFEFESVEVSLDDLRRFRTYEAYTAMVYKKPVITYVVCSGKVNRIHSELREGINCYRIIPLHMKQKDADALIKVLRTKALRGGLTKENLAPLLLTPLMAGKSSIKDRILAVTEILGEENIHLSKEDRQHMEAVLYAFACKFLQKVELDEIKEVLSMTVLGEMIWSDGEQKGMEKGMEQGMEKGIERGSNMKLITQICLKLQKGKTPNQIADDLEEELSVVESIYEIARKLAPSYDCEEIYRILTTDGSGFHSAQ
ncbi:MAG: hypothetical protein NC231_02410 [Bacillus sp. (in: Bacteria)]|nr:hypothetical protein [Bacillus sp. (in: firmicutes)]MCM1425559.1 hypothetical protein [Eubacterium sp.]